MRAHGFRFYFTPLPGVLFTFPSRYSFAIGLSVVFSLSGWSPMIQPGFLVSRPTQGPNLTDGLPRVRGPHPLRPAVPDGSARPSPRHAADPTTPARALRRRRFGPVPFRSPLLGESLLLSSPARTKMFQFRAFAPRTTAGWRDRSRRVAPFGHPRINGHLPLPAAFRSLSRPSSPPRAQASPVRPSPFRCAFAGNGSSCHFRFVSPLHPPARSHANPPTGGGTSARGARLLLLFALVSRSGTGTSPPRASSMSVSSFLVVLGRVELPTSTLSV